MLWAINGGYNSLPKYLTSQTCGQPCNADYSLWPQKNHYNQISKHLKKPWKISPRVPYLKAPHIIDTPRRDIVFQIMQQVWIHVAKSKLGSKFLLHCWEVRPPGISDGEVRDNEERLHTPGAWRGLLCSPLISGGDAAVLSWSWIMRSKKSKAFTPANRTTPGVIFFVHPDCWICKKKHDTYSKGRAHCRVCFCTPLSIARVAPAHWV